MRRTRSLAALLLAVALAAAACGDDDTGGTTATTGGDSTPPQPPPATAWSLVVTVGSGMPSLDELVQGAPTYHLSSDGTLTFWGPVPAIYPGPLIRDLMAVDLDGGALAEAVRLIDAGELSITDGEITDTDAADAGITLLTYTDETGAHTWRVAGLRAGSDDPRVVALGDLVDLLDRQAAGAGAVEASPDRLQVVALSEEPSDAGVDVTVPWDSALDTVPFGGSDGASRCGVVAGPAVGGLVDALGAVHSRTFFEGDDGTVRLLVRPLFPHEAGCGA